MTEWDCGNYESRQDCSASELLNINQPTNMLQKIPNTLKRIFNDDKKALYRAGYINGDSALTDEGKKELLNLLAQEHEKELADLAREDIEDIEEAKE